MKRRIKQTAWGNWNGYEGTRKVKEFGCNGLRADGAFHDELQEWLDEKPKAQTLVSCEPNAELLIEALARLR